MTIDEAIKLLEQDTSGEDYDYDPRLPEAMKLGVEALKRIKLQREIWGMEQDGPLSGETEETGE